MEFRRRPKMPGYGVGRVWRTAAEDAGSDHNELAVGIIEAKGSENIGTKRYF